MSDRRATFLDGSQSLVVGQPYNIAVTIRGENKNDVLWRTVGTVTPETAEEIDLGRLWLKPSYQPPTLDERITQAFAEDGAKGTPIERFASATRDAELSKQHVLVLFGDPTGEAVRGFMRRRFEDNEFRRALDPYRVLAVSTRGENFDDANELAEKLRLSLSEAMKGLLIAISDSEGNLLVSKTAEAATSEPPIDQEVSQLLGTHAPGALDARQLLDEALARAREQNKRVIVQETATWCAPCWKLSRFLDGHREQWEQDYIWVKMDHRWEHAVEIMKEYRKGANGGVPWWAILDSDGNVLITSNAADGGNIGYPSDEAGRAHFRKMLESTAIRLEEQDIDHLYEALAEEGP